MKRFLIILISLFILSGCSIAKYSSVVQHSSFDGYKYFYVTDTSSSTDGYGSIYGGQYGLYGSQVTKSVNPTDIISGRMMKQGFVRLPALKQDLLDETIIVSYGESGRHNYIIAYAIEVTLQFLDAKTLEIIAMTTAAGMGDTESDDIKIAVNKCFQNLFR